MKKQTIALVKCGFGSMLSRFLSVWPLVLTAVVLAASLSAVGVLAATNLDPPGTPADAGTQMYTLQQIYNRLKTGEAVTQMTVFTEPDSAPDNSMHTLDDIMVVAVPGAIARRVPKTGQIISNSLGDDGFYQIGITPIIAPGDADFPYRVPDWTGVRFTNNGDGTATDNLTSLIWLRNANCTTFFPGDNTGQNNRSWNGSLTASNSLANGYCGLSDGSNAGDWRLPNINELHSLIDSTQTDPALPVGHHFFGIQTDPYWSSTGDSCGLKDCYWTVRLSDDYFIKWTSGSFYVLPVRKGE